MERKQRPEVPVPEQIERWHHPGPPTVDEVPEEIEEQRLEATRRQQKMTEDKTGEAE
ncbi:MAG TPA: hypothetical protein GX715_09455 [Armatimonadetes bacterium]|jgi:hypothetical protein|nr:hypothetical protein [Armatimonadota bacterium]HHX40177.1 hypothetical protein [Armatimonadota bacterium]HOJ22495.1 hypothetical protein [Armatimonadota bacterium]HOM82259.1 hypothetical protein [Armatimonadota bacterium]HPO73006.1 hypothetical protein [Armatimonadota bacterium]